MNSLTITGNLGKDAETRFLQDGKAVVSFSVADSMGKDKPSIWWNCAMFGDRAQKLSQYLTKGQQVTVIGTVTEREFMDKEGNKRKSMDIRVADLALQGGRKEEAPRAETRAPAPKQANTGGFEDMDSDIPFINPMRGSARCLAM